MLDSHDALVVGAGPVGSYTAYQLARRGHKVIVFDKRREVGDKDCCTGIVSTECLDRFPIDRSAICTEARSANFFSPSGRMLSMRKDTVQAYVMNRKLLDQAMARQAEAEGVEYVLPARVDDIRFADHGVRAEVDHGGRVTEFSAKVAIIATGFGSMPAKRARLGKIDDYVLGAQAEVALDGADEVEVYFGQDIAPGFFAWLVPISGGSGRVGLLSRRDPGSRLRQLLDRLHAEGKIAAPEAGMSFGAIPLKPLPKSYGQRLVVVGDAAGQVKPTTGGGIYYGLLSADIAADTVHGAIVRNDVSPRSLARYDQEWRKLLIRELQLGYIARRTYENLSDAQIDRIFEIVQSNGMHEDMLSSPHFSFDWHVGPMLRAANHKLLGRAI
jgi:digeranylgeranylglycerophospholipid reductase